MKILSVLLCLMLLLTGCGSAAKNAATPETYVETTTPAPRPDVLMTEDDALTIALEHAGLTPDQVESSFVSYEIDDEAPGFEVEFRVGATEYEYFIHAKTGEILSFDMGD